MEAYEVHKKVQEAIMAIEIYQLSSALRASMWHAEIIKGLEQLAKHRQVLSPNSKSANVEG